MADATIRVVINHAAARQLERSVEVLDELAERAARVAEAATRNGGETDARPPEYSIERYVGRNRARVTVATANDEARAGEARHHWLLGALDAAR